MSATVGFWRRRLANNHIKAFKGDQRLITRHWGVIASVDTTAQTVTAYLDGSETAVGPIYYNASVPPPNVGETWAFDVVQNSWLALHASAAGGATYPSYDAAGAADTAKAQAQQYTDTAILAVFNYQGGPLTTTGLSGPFPVRAPSTCTVIEIDAALGTTDGSNDVTVTLYLNGNVIAAITIPAGAQQAHTDIPAQDFGATGDLIQAAITTYAGSSAGDLVVTLRTGSTGA